jgi:hypothetical protein
MPNKLVDEPILVTYMLFMVTIIVVTDAQVARRGVRSAGAALTNQAPIRRDFVAISSIIMIPLHRLHADARSLQVSLAGLRFAP